MLKKYDFIHSFNSSLELLLLLTSEETELLWRSLFPFWMVHKTRHFSDGYLFVQSTLWIFLTERLDNI